MGSKGLSVRWRAAVVVLAAAGLVLAAAGGAGASSSAAKPKKGGAFTFLFNTEPPGADVLQLREVPNISPGLMAGAIYDQLVYANPKTLKLVPGIATGITTSDKGLTWTMKLHAGVRFSDGTPYDAEAVKFNWLRDADPANKAVFGYVAAKIATYTVVDPQTLKVTLTTADPLFDQEIARNLAWNGSPTAIKASGANFSIKPVGAGPFLLKEWIRGVSQTYVRNPDYWQKGKPYVDEIDMKFLSDDTARLNTMTTGAAQVALDGAFTNITQYQQSGKFNLYNTPAFGGGNSFGMNLTKPPFDDIRVRQAMALVLDSKEFVQRTGDGDDTWVIKTVDEKGSPYYNPKFKLPVQDVAAAQKLIDAYIADKNGGKPIEFLYLALNVPNHIRASVAFQAMIQSKLKNVTMKIDQQEPATGVGRIARGDFQAYYAGNRWADARLDMPQYYQTNASSNYGKYSNPTVDAAMTTLMNATDPKTIAQAENTIVEQTQKDVVVVPVQRFRVYYAVNKAALSGFHIFYELRALVQDVWLKKPQG